MSDLSARIAANLARVRERVEASCARAGRSVSDVRLVAVTKYASIDWVRALVALGIRDLGESRPQQLVDRAGTLDRPVLWHLIGHLQRNKVRAVLPSVHLIHSVDSLRLAQRIDEVAGELGRRPAVLLETNVSGEASKDGFDRQSLLAAWGAIRCLPNLDVVGLMTMAPAAEDPRAARPTFRGLRELRDELRRASPEGQLPELSMGMSGDFEVAIEEGATLVRIGSALFDGLH